MKKYFFIFAALLCGLTAMSQQTTNPQNFKSVDVEQFAKQIANNQTIIMDVRTEKEFASGHIKDAINIVWGNTFEQLLQNTKLDKKTTIAVYCRSGRRSKMAANVLVKHGYTVIELNAGIVSWQKAGKEVVIDK